MHAASCSPLEKHPVLKVKDELYMFPEVPIPIVSHLNLIGFKVSFLALDVTVYAGLKHTLKPLAGY